MSIYQLCSSKEFFKEAIEEDATLVKFANQQFSGDQIWSAVDKGKHPNETDINVMKSIFLMEPYKSLEVRFQD